MTQRRRPANRQRQPGLFDPSPQAPKWALLAPDVRKSVTKLVAQMMRAHQDRQGERHLEATVHE